MDRDQNLSQLQQVPHWDLVVIGGGATGLGVALDAASRGYQVALFEQSDFAKGTSSRSTKLVHGGVRYLQQGDVSLVTEALRERNLLRKNAPHLVGALQFIVPSYRWYDSTYYGLGLKAYDLLAGKNNLGRSRHVSRDEAHQLLPTVRTNGLRGGTLYVDGSFDDARLAVSIAQTACEQGAALVNYMQVTELLKDESGRVAGVSVQDLETGTQQQISATTVVNATGPFTDKIRRMDNPEHSALIAASQGVHIVLDASFLPGETALMIPRTEDGRVLFAIPWHGVTVIGTTDTPIDEVALEPKALDSEIEFLLRTANQYFSKRIERHDIRSVFVGIRPLIKSSDSSSDSANTSKLSRDHTILIDEQSQLITVAGGKWTTYRNMAEDVVDTVAEVGKLTKVDCKTKEMRLHGATDETGKFGALAVYGTDAREIQSLMRSDTGLAQRIHPDVAMPVAEVVWACRQEMARTVDDMLARRSRWLLLDARLAIAAAEPVAQIMKTELGRDDAWAKQQVELFTELARGYLPQ